MPRRNLRCIEPERLWELFDYDVGLGELIWRDTPSKPRRAKAGSVAGHLNKLGYREVRIDTVFYLAHRLIWIWTHGRMPDGEVNHVGQEGLSPKQNHIHRIAEMTTRDHRKLTAAVNKASGLPLGVHRCDRYDAYKASIRSPLTGKQVHLGTYDTVAEAAAAYRAANILIDNEVLK